MTHYETFASWDPPVAGSFSSKIPGCSIAAFYPDILQTSQVGVSFFLSTQYEVLLHQFSVRLYGQGFPSALLYAVLNMASGDPRKAAVAPTGPDLAVSSVFAATGGLGWSWVDFAFQDYLLIPGNAYTLSLRAAQPGQLYPDGWVDIAYRSLDYPTELYGIFLYAGIGTSPHWFVDRGYTINFRALGLRR